MAYPVHFSGSMDFRPFIQFLLPFLTLAMAWQARAEQVATLTTPASVKGDVRAANGDCLPAFGGEPALIAQQQKVTVARANGQAVEPVLMYVAARFANTLGEIGSGEFTMHHGVTFTILSTFSLFQESNDRAFIPMRPSLENRAVIRLNRHGGSENYAALATEMGRYMLRVNPSLLQAYKRAVPEVCIASTSANIGRDVEFVESFAAFITNPDLLENGGAPCEKARLHMASLFKESPVRSETCSARYMSLNRLRRMN